MIIGEIGYPLLTRGESNLFFQLVPSRYKKRLTTYTSIKSFSEWGELLGDTVRTSAVLYRILPNYPGANIRVSHTGKRTGIRIHRQQ